MSVRNCPQFFFARKAPSAVGSRHQNPGPLRWDSLGVSLAAVGASTEAGFWSKRQQPHTQALADWRFQAPHGALTDWCTPAAAEALDSPGASSCALRRARPHTTMNPQNDPKMTQDDHFLS